MADKNDVVIIELDRPRQLWFGHKALKTLGALTGKTLDGLMEEMENMDFEDIEKIFYCGLLTDAKRNGEELKLEDMEDLLDFLPFGVLTQYMTKALSASFGNVAGEQGKNVRGIAERKK